MLGFFTIVSLLVAFKLGGWWWAGFALLLLAWLGRRGEAKQEAVIKLDTNELRSDDGPVSLLEACSSLTGTDYYIGDLIPDTKRAAAMANYPLPGDGAILAMIDATVFGSAKNGLAVGKDGISWNNGSEKPVQIVWSVLAQSLISASGNDVSVDSLKFDTSGTAIQIGQVKDLILRLQVYARSITASETSSVQKPKRERPAASKPANDAKLVVLINNADFVDLLSLPGIGAAEAQMIIKRRGERSFSSNLELVDYLELKPHIASRLDGLIDFGPSIALAEAHTEVPKQTVGNVPRTTSPAGRTID